MALNEPAQGIAFLIKTTGRTADEVQSLVSDYSVRETKGTLESDPAEFDGLIGMVLDSLAKKEISVSSLLAKWNTFCYNLKDGYCSADWLKETSESTASDYEEIVSQESLNRLNDDVWGNDKLDYLKIRMPGSLAKDLKWVGCSGSIGERFSLKNINIVKSKHDILDSGFYEITLEKGISMDGWDGLVLPREGSLYVDGLDRLTEGETLWDTIPEEASDYRGENYEKYVVLWNAAKRGFEIASAYGSAVTGGKIYNVVYKPVTQGSLWPEAMLSAAALGGLYGKDLEELVETYVWVSANSETKGYSGQDRDSREFQVLANRVNILAWDVKVARR